jgi:hypothetical protein
MFVCFRWLQLWQGCVEPSRMCRDAGISLLHMAVK